jgi:hypothetical protein
MALFLPHTMEARILLLSSVTDKMSTKNLLSKFFASVFKDRKSKRCKKIAEITVFQLFLLVDGRIQTLKNDDGPGSSNNLRIHNTDELLTNF